MNEFKKFARLSLLGFALVSVMGTGIIACSDDNETSSTSSSSSSMSSSVAATETSPSSSSLSGSVAIDGSSTVYPVEEAVAEEFGKLHPDVKVTVGQSGTGGGFKKFCAGETDVSGASRNIKDTEAALCAENNIKFTELKVGLDGISVVVSSKNDFVTDITADELKKMWDAPAEGAVMNWSDVNPAWPAEEMKLYGPGVDSGTFDFFTKKINGKEKQSRGDYGASEDDNVIVNGVSGSKYGLGYFGYAYYLANQDKLNLLAVNGTQPSPATIASKEYLISRPLFIYVNNEYMKSKPQLRAFIEYFVGDGIALVSDPSVGYTDLPASELEATRALVEGL